MRFTQNVMENIARQHIAPAAQSYINKRVIRGIAWFFFTSIGGFLVYSFLTVNWSGPSGFNWTIDTSKLDFTKFFNSTFNNIFIMVNIVLGLMLLDMYLTTRKKQLLNKQS